MLLSMHMPMEDGCNNACSIQQPLTSCLDHRMPEDVEHFEFMICVSGLNSNSPKFVVFTQACSK